MAVRKLPFHLSTLSYIFALNATALLDETKSGEPAIGAIATPPQAPCSIRADSCM